MGRKRGGDDAPTTEPVNGDVVTGGATAVVDGPPLPEQPASSTLPVAEAKAPNGERPFAKFGPYPTSSKRTFLTVAVWKKEVVVEGGEVVQVFNVALNRSYYDAAGQPKNSNTLRASELQLAILLLEKADRFIRELKTGDQAA